MLKSSTNPDVKIEVNELRSIGFTSLDILQGKIYLHLTSELSITCIQLKFEGYCKSILKERKNDKVLVKEEDHILINDIQTLFPKREISDISYDNKKIFNLKPGEYQYDFQFKIPLNSICDQQNFNSNNSKSSSSKFKLTSSSSSLELNNIRQNIHKTSILPPSFKSDSSEIEYYLKLIIIRSSKLKSNIKKEMKLKIIPFNGIEFLHKVKLLSFIRNQIIFKDKLPEVIGIIEEPIIKPKRIQSAPSTPKLQERSTFDSFKSLIWGGSPSSSKENITPPPPPLPKKDIHHIIESFDVLFYFEVRSFGFIQFIDKPLNYLRFYLLSKTSPKKYLAIDGLSSGLGSIYLKRLIIELIIITKTKSQDLIKEETKILTLSDLKIGSFKLDLSKAKKSKAINESTGSPYYELEIPPELYSDIPLPSNLSPSFKFCNIERSYKLNIKATFTDIRNGKKGKNVELDVPISILSGISPPLGFETLPAPTRKLPSYEEALITR